MSDLYLIPQNMYAYMSDLYEYMSDQYLIPKYHGDFDRGTPHIKIPPVKRRACIGYRVGTKTSDVFIPG